MVHRGDVVHDRVTKAEVNLKQNLHVPFTTVCFA